MFNFYVYKKIRRYGRSRKYKLQMSTIPSKFFQVVVSGMYMAKNVDYKYNKESNQIVFNFLPEIKSYVYVNDFQNRRKK